jgi:hypothetical protein
MQSSSNSTLKGYLKHFYFTKDGLMYHTSADQSPSDFYETDWNIIPADFPGYSAICTMFCDAVRNNIPLTYKRNKEQTKKISETVLHYVISELTFDVYRRPNQNQNKYHDKPYQKRNDQNQNGNQNREQGGPGYKKYPKKDQEEKLE